MVLLISCGDVDPFADHNKGLCNNYLDGGVGKPEGGMGENHNYREGGWMLNLILTGGALLFSLFFTN